MLHPLFSTIIQRPDLVIDHVSAYGALLGQEAKAAGSQFLVRAVASLLALVCATVFMTLTGIALMLGFLQDQFHWILVAVPGAAFLLAIVAVLKAMKPIPAEHFSELKAQLEYDRAALQQAA